MPLMRHSLTEGGLIWHKLATAAVPPSASMIAESLMGLVLGMPYLIAIGTPYLGRVSLP